MNSFTWGSNTVEYEYTSGPDGIVIERIFLNGTELSDKSRFFEMLTDLARQDYWAGYDPVDEIECQGRRSGTLID